MKILVDVLHPKHVHFFRPLLHHWKKRGDTVRVVTRDKDITHHLLRLYNIPFTCLSRQQTGIKMLAELLSRWIKMGFIIKGFRPDMVLSISGISTAFPSWVFRIPNIAFTDTETAELSNKISFPFASKILTPSWFKLDYGNRHFRYDGFHEWCYLHPDHFKPSAKIVEMENIDPGAPYCILRLVKWEALHDKGEYGLKAQQINHLIEQLEYHMKVYISSEVQLPPKFQRHSISINPNHMHHIMAFSNLVIGESPSMCAEAALLGIPSILISSWAGRCGNMIVLEKKFNLMQVYSDGGQAIQAALQLVEGNHNYNEFIKRRLRLVKELDYIPDIVQKHMNSLMRGHIV